MKKFLDVLEVISLVILMVICFFILRNQYTLIEKNMVANSKALTQMRENEKQHFNSLCGSIFAKDSLLSSTALRVENIATDLKNLKPQTTYIYNTVKEKPTIIKKKTEKTIEKKIEYKNQFHKAEPIYLN